MWKIDPGAGRPCARRAPAAWLAMLLVLSGSALRAQAPDPAAAASPAAQAWPPARLFYQRPNIEAAVLSPSGRWLALSTRAESQRTMLVVFDLVAWKLQGAVARFVDADIAGFHWVNDERLVFSLIDHQRGGGDQRFNAGLFSVGRDGRDLRELVSTTSTRLRGERRLGVEPLSPSHRLLHVPATGGDDVIVGESRFTETGEPSGVLAKRLNVVTGRVQTLSLGLPGHVFSWWFEPSGEPKAVTTLHEGRSAVYWRDAGATDWRQIAAAPRWKLPFAPRFVDAGGTLYVAVPQGRDGVQTLTRFDFATGRPEPAPLVSTPGFDFSGRIVSETDGGRALGVRVVTDAETTVWFDPTLAAVQVEADKRLPGQVNRLNCRPCSGPDTTVLVHSWSDRDPGQFWVHRPADKTWRAVGAVRRDIEPAAMATTDFERIRARDGLEFPVWITRPAGVASGPQPAVVLVHGGPWVRGRHWRWDADAQFLASRGYVVIEPEFRGSTGYGARLFAAGIKQWGQAMQDDVADALTWAVKRGDVDPRRVCIAGASYGGYATLMGLIRHPDLYRCGVAWVAVTDPRLRYEWRNDSDANDEVRNFSLPELVGDPARDAAMLDAVTPVLHADRILAPLFMAFGAADRRVPLVHGTRMREALRDVGREPVYVVYPDEGHGWLRLETRVDFAERMASFLSQHLQAPAVNPKAAVAP